MLGRMKSLLGEAEALRHKLDQLHDVADKVVAEASPLSDTQKIRKDVDDLEDRHGRLTQSLRDKCSNLESNAHIVGQYNDRVKCVNADLSNLEEQLDGMKPVGRDVDTVKAQIKEVRAFLEAVENKKDEVEDAANACQEIVERGCAPDPRSCKEKLSALQRQVSKLEDRGKLRSADLVTVLAKLEAFYDDFNQLSGDINGLLREEENFKPVGGDVDTIRHQQEEFKVFNRKRVQPLGVRVEEQNKVGQGLVQSAAPGVSTLRLDSDLDKLNGNWNNLKEKLLERERRLDVALLQSGKFQEALTGLLKWLDETEDLIANQKPPSADYKVVKAQLQEQKFLNKMLLDRQGSVSSLGEMGEDIMKNADRAEEEQIRGQLQDLVARFDNLMTTARNRTDDLERAMEVAKDFQDRAAPLAEWLERCERRLTGMQVIPTDDRQLRALVEAHEDLHNDILSYKPAFDELVDIAQALMPLVGDDEAQQLADRLQELTDRYTTLVDESENLGNLLRVSIQNVGTFVVNLDDLSAWMDEMEARLQRYGVLSVFVDKLREQLDEIVELTDEVASHQKNVDEVIFNGTEIMKHSSGEDMIQVKERLDWLQHRFNDLGTKAADLLQKAHNALPLVEQFHECHTRLSNWMLDAESKLSSLESATFEHQEEEIQILESDIQTFRTVLETVNIAGPKLCQISPGEGASHIESIMHRDNRRFEAICERVQRKAEHIEMAKKRSHEVVGDLDELLDWFRDAERQLVEADGITSDADHIRLLLKEQKALNDDINSQRGRFRDVQAATKKLLRDQSLGEDMSHVRERLEELRGLVDVVTTMSADRLSALDQALPLAEHFYDTHLDLVQYFEEAEADTSILASTAATINIAEVRRQQEAVQQLLSSVAEHKPVVDRLNKVGSVLAPLCCKSHDVRVREVMQADTARYTQLRDILRQLQASLEEAQQATSQFSDKLDGMLNALNSTADQVNNAEPISAFPPKIEEQMDDNSSIIAGLNKKSSALEAVRKTAEEVIKKAGVTSDPAVKDIKNKLDRLNDLWATIKAATSDRGRSLEDALKVADRFWDELNTVMKALKELQDSLASQEPPAVEPSAIQQQQEALQEIKQEMNETKPEVDHCRQTGQSLMELCGEPDKPEVKKNIEDLENAWENITSLFAKREENLIDAMEKAMTFHDTLHNLLEFLDTAEEKFSNLGALGSDTDTVKAQIRQLKDFKLEVDPHMVEVEALNRQAQELTERTSQDQALAIKEPLADVNHRWDDLLKGIVGRQRQLENALLKLGQFQHALDELLVWMGKTEKNMDELKPVVGDPQVIEVELAKLKVVMNDINAHQSSVDTLNDAGRQLIEQDKGSEDASATQKKLGQLNTRWHSLKNKASERKRELEDALKEAQAFNQEIQDLLQWLGDVDALISMSKPVGGLPESARDQLERFMAIHQELEGNRPKVESILQQGSAYLKRSGEGTAKNLQHNLKTLRQRWDNVLNRANDKKIKLEIALKEAIEFHEALQSFIAWLTGAEKHLVEMTPASRVLPTVLKQIEEHKDFQKEIGAHREVMLNLDKKGTHLKYFSQKQDVILIKNLLISVQHRWERVVAKAAERTRQLDHGYKEAKEFNDSWTDLCKWLDNAEKQLDEPPQVGNEPAKIKQFLARHKEFQRTLGGKQPTYDATMKMGRVLRDKAYKTDVPVIQDMMNTLKNKWNTICAKSVDRQRKLEESLLVSGQYKDAIQALLDWLDRVRKDLNENQPVHGDLDTVTALYEQHKTLKEELNNRQSNMESVRKSASELTKSAQPDDVTHIESQIKELDGKWRETSRLADVKQKRLDDALRQAQELHKAVHMLLEWLSDAEMKLRFASPLPEDEATTREQIAEHERFLQEMSAKAREKNATVTLAQEILQKCHPDAVTVIKHWITIIQSRWDEVTTWANQRKQRLDDHLRSLMSLFELLDELLAWVKKAELTMVEKEAQELPEDIPAIEALVDEHEAFMDDLKSRQADVERVTKGGKQRAQAPKAPSPTGAAPASTTAAAKSPTKGTTPAKDKEPVSRTSSKQKTSTPAKVPTEQTIKNPKARELFDRWRRVWVLALERQRRLLERLNHQREVEKMKSFSWDDWRRRFVRWMNNQKSRIMDFFRKMDKDNDGKLTREEFITGILKSRFPTNRLELNAIADMFDHGDGMIDIKEFVDALRPERESNRPKTDHEMIQDEVQRQVQLCTCVAKFRVLQVGEGKYRFGESQKLRLVRILRSTVMVRVGGGWVALDEFLVKNDPCRAKGRTNIELREQFILAQGVSQSMSPFKSKSPNSSQSSQSGTASFANRSSASLSSAGPITKIREKSARSSPMGGRGASSTPDSSDHHSHGHGHSHAETNGRKPFRLTGLASSGSSGNLSPSSTTPGRTPSRPGSRPSSRPPSRPSSRPPSRANSDLSVDSTDGISATGRARKPSGGTGTTQRRGAGTTSGTTASRIPTKKTPQSGPTWK